MCQIDLVLFLSAEYPNTYSKSSPCRPFEADYLNKNQKRVFNPLKERRSTTSFDYGNTSQAGVFENSGKVSNP